jgi:mRNA interferase YafQ
MLSIERTKAYIKDIKKIKFSDTQYRKYILYLGKLLNQETLPPEARGHHLKGEWRSFREFHLGGDLLVIYKTEDETLYLVRIGNHSQLFKKF